MSLIKTGVDDNIYTNVIESDLISSEGEKGNNSKINNSDRDEIIKYLLTYFKTGNYNLPNINELKKRYPKLSIYL